jgi:hypothetical protein
MSERSRRRRRRRRTNTGGDAQRSAQRETPQGQPVVAREQASQVGRPRRRRRGRARGGQERASSPKSSEDLVRALPRERPATLTAPPDGQTLEVLIGELQSEYGVPQYPQEYRITVKVADDKDRGERPAPEEPGTAAAPSTGNGSPRREKAPAMTAAPGATPGEKLPGPSRKRSRRRRRRRGGGGGGGGAGSGGGGPTGQSS